MEENLNFNKSIEMSLAHHQVQADFKLDLKQKSKIDGIFESAAAELRRECSNFSQMFEQMNNKTYLNEMELILEKLTQGSGPSAKFSKAQAFLSKYN